MGEVKNYKYSEDIRDYAIASKLPTRLIGLMIKEQYGVQVCKSTIANWKKEKKDKERMIPIKRDIKLVQEEMRLKYLKKKTLRKEREILRFDIKRLRLELMNLRLEKQNKGEK